MSLMSVLSEFGQSSAAVGTRKHCEFDFREIAAHATNGADSLSAERLAQIARAECPAIVSMTVHAMQRSRSPASMIA